MKQLNQMLQQAQQMQKQMETVQATLEQAQVEGVSGAGLVRVVASGKGDVKKLSIDKTLVDPNEIEMLEDLIVAAIHDARKRADELSRTEMAKVTGGVTLPPGFKMPF